LAGREHDAERHHRKVHGYLEQQAARLRERQAQGKPPRLEHTFRPVPSPAEFDVWIEIERAYVLLYKGDLETAERIVRSLREDNKLARYSRSAVLSDLARWAGRQRRWDKVEELLTIAIREPLFPQHWIHGAWLAVAADAQQAGQTELAARWAKNAATAFCRLDPDRREWFRSLPRSHPGYRKPFVLPYLDSVFLFMAVREGRLPTYAR
jgi:hypothetical protein